MRPATASGCGARALPERKILAPIVTRDPARPRRAALSSGFVYRATGQRELERAVWYRLLRRLSRSGARIDKEKVARALYVAAGARYLGGWQDANGHLATPSTPIPRARTARAANLRVGASSSRSSTPATPRRRCSSGSMVLPKDADAHALYARVKIEQNDSARRQRECRRRWRPIRRTSPR